jgi:phenylacetate-CoA ligase
LARDGRERFKPQRFITMLKAALYSLLRFAARGSDVEEYRELINRHPAAELRNDLLIRLLRFCQEQNPYYRAVLAGKTITVDTFAELPVLTKALIGTRFDDLRSDGLKIKTYLNSSGGSTGLPVTLLQDSEYANWSGACEAQYFREFLNVAPHRVKKVVLWGSERDTFGQRNLRATLSNWLSNTVFLNTFDISRRDLLEYVERINECRPHFIKGYAGSLYEISRVINSHKLTVHSPKFVCSSAEMLRDFMRREIEQAFNAKVYDFYGSREVGPIAGECGHGRKHIFVYNNIVETVDDDGNTLNNGLVGRILVTNLHNYSMPLLRYDIGDTGSMSDVPCPCGSDLPYLVELKGRITDHFKTKDGSLVHGEYFTHLFYFRPWVAEFQVNQLELDHIQICIVKNLPPDDADIRDIESKIRLVMGDDCKLTWEYLECIPRTAQGKHLFTRSLVG